MKSMVISSDLRSFVSGNTRGKQQGAIKCENERNQLLSMAASGKSSGRAAPAPALAHRNDNQKYKTYQTEPEPLGQRSRCLWPRAWALGSLSKLRSGLAGALSVLLALTLLLAAIDTRQTEAASTGAAPSSTTGAGRREANAALEAELNSLLDQHDANSQDSNSKLLSEAIISRWMLGNLSDAATSGTNAVNELAGLSSDLDGSADLAALLPADVGQSAAGGEPEQQPAVVEQELSGPEALRLRKMLSYMRNYELASGLNNGQVFSQFPVLPASQAATIKRASLKMGSYLRQQQQHQQHGQQRQLNGYGRNSFDFGLGKRPDASVAGSILRFGDSAGVPVSSQFGKRPSAHRYDFGLGKRVASPAYPRYDFGLGKRAPNRVRYDFGLGKR